MQKHDPQATNNDTSTPHFNGEEIEFAPFMFDASPETAQTTQGTFSGSDVQFEPFMFDQGESAFGMSNQAAPVEQGSTWPGGAGEPVMPAMPDMAAMPVMPMPATPVAPVVPMMPVAPIQPL